MEFLALDVWVPIKIHSYMKALNPCEQLRNASAEASDAEHVCIKAALHSTYRVNCEYHENINYSTPSEQFRLEIEIKSKCHNELSNIRIGLFNSNIG